MGFFSNFIGANSSPRPSFTPSPAPMPHMSGFGNINIEELAEQQMRLNEQLARLQSQFSFVDEVGPFGSVNFSGDPESGFTRTTTLDPFEQQMFGRQQHLRNEQFNILAKLLNQQGVNANRPLNVEGLPELPGGSGFGDFRQGIEDRLFNAERGRLDERFGDEREQLMQELANRGIPVGSELFNRQIQEFDDRRNRAFTEARESAFRLAGGEADRAFNQGLQRRGSAFGERLQVRQQPAVEFGALLGGTVPPQVPQFRGSPGVPVQGIDAISPAVSLRNAQLAADTSRANASTAANASIFGSIIGSPFAQNILSGGDPQPVGLFNNRSRNSVFNNRSRGGGIFAGNIFG